MEKKIMVFAGLAIMVIVLNACPCLGHKHKHNVRGQTHNKLAENGPAAAGHSCDADIVEMLACATFVMGPAAGKPPPECCEGVKLVLGKADNEEKRRALCECLKDEATKAQVQIIPAKLKNITEPCEIKVPIPTDANVDCKTVPVF